MPSNPPDSDLDADPALRRAEAARDAVAEALDDHLERLAALGRTAGSDLDADLQAAGRLVARTTQRQLAANLALVQDMMAARTLPALLQVQQAFLRRQMDWAVRDWDLARAQALDLLAEGRRAARGDPAGHQEPAGHPEPTEDPDSAVEPDPAAPPADPGPS
jgi:hypothetical protein